MTNLPPKAEPMETSATIEAANTSAEFDPVDLESSIIQLCLQFPHGVSDKILENQFPTVSLSQRVQAINRLLSLTKIDLLKSNTEPGKYIYRIHDSSTSSASSILTGGGVSDQMEKLVYSLVKDSGKFGIWMRDIRFKTQLSQIPLTKTLKSLESKKLIKAVKSVHASKKKVYMLYDMIPDASITGGTFISDHGIEEDFVCILSDQCARLLDERLEESTRKFPNDPFIRRSSSFMSSNDLVVLVNEIGIATVTLTVQDIESILTTLIYDGKIEKMTVASTTTADKGTKQNLYRSVKPVISSAPIVRNPCGICPVFKDCHTDGLITPETCIYLNNWLDF